MMSKLFMFGNKFKTLDVNEAKAFIKLYTDSWEPKNAVDLSTQYRYICTTLLEYSNVKNYTYLIQYLTCAWGESQVLKASIGFFARYYTSECGNIFFEALVPLFATLNKDTLTQHIDLYNQLLTKEQVIQLIKTNKVF